jgi:hypothetical protein
MQLTVLAYMGRLSEYINVYGMRWGQPLSNHCSLATCGCSDVSRWAAQQGRMWLERLLLRVRACSELLHVSVFPGGSSCRLAPLPRQTGMGAAAQSPFLLAAPLAFR